LAQEANSLKAVYFALGGNFAIAIAKYVAAAITGSSSMLAEAVHSSADCGNQLLLLLGLKRSKRPPTSEYPLGFGKETYFWSFIVALMLFSLGGLFSIYEGCTSCTRPSPSPIR
jgi:divalent metal cation (Fe/Co/Zn/Cd) transporter